MKAGTHRDGFGRRLAVHVMMAAAVFGSPEIAHAQMPTVRAYVEPPEVVVGQPFEVVIELSGVQDVQSVSVPADLGLAASASRLAGTMMWAGVERTMQQGSVFTVRYSFFDTPEPGSVEIGLLRVAADGYVLETEPVTLLITANEGLAVRVRADPPTVKRGDIFELVVEVLGDGSLTDWPELPDIFDFAENTGSASGSSNSYSYTFRATSAGEFEIPPVQVRVDGETHETEPARLVVTDEPSTVSVRSTIHSGVIWVGGEFVVRVEVDGVTELDAEPVPPATEGFAEVLEADADAALLPVPSARPIGDRSLVRHFRLRALAAGRFEIGPVRLMADGREFTTNPIENVVDALPTADTELPFSARFVTMRSGRVETPVAYVNEPLILSFAILHRNPHRPDVNTGTVSWPSLEGFEAVELPRRGWWRGTQPISVDGVNYNVLIVRRVAVLPGAAGTMAIGPATVEAQQGARPFRLPRTGAPAFTSAILTSDPVVVEVLPLPEAGRPESFRGHVGTLDVTSWVDRTSVAAGDTLTLEVEVDVRGYLRGLPAPDIDFPDAFEVAAPEIRDAFLGNSDGLSGMRTYIYRLVAVVPGTYEIPAVEMSWFDPEREAYGVSRGQPFTITVVSAGEEGR